MTSTARLVNLAMMVLRREEGFSKSAYLCTAGYPTIGYGLRIGPEHAALSNYIFTVSRKTADVMLQQNVERRLKRLHAMPFFIQANTPRKVIFISMAYQLGLTRLSKFKKTIHAAEQGEWSTVALEALDSKWASEDTPTRALRHARVLRSGRLEDAYKVTEEL